MCFFCGNDLPRTEIDKYQQINNHLNELLSVLRTENCRLTSRLQEVEHELDELKMVALENHSSDEAEDVLLPSLTTDVFGEKSFFSIATYIVENGMMGNPFYAYDGDSEKKVEVGNDDVVGVVKAQVESAISEIAIEGRVRKIEFVCRTPCEFDEEGNRWIRVGFSVEFQKLLPCELYVLMKAVECTYSDSVKVIDLTEIHMLENNRNWELFYHTIGDDTVIVELKFDLYADDSGYWDAGREHVISFLRKANTTVLLHKLMSFEEKNPNR